MPGRITEGASAKLPPHMNRRRFLVCPLLLLLAQCSGTGSSKPPLRGADRDRFAIVAEEVLAASSFTILEGLPRPMDLVPPSAYGGGGNPFRQLTAGEDQRLAALSKRYLKRELASKTTTALHGYHFYEAKSDVSAAEIETLRTLCSSRRSFAPYGGPRFCGGFLIRTSPWYGERKAARTTF